MKENDLQIEKIQREMEKIQKEIKRQMQSESCRHHVLNKDEIERQRGETFTRISSRDGQLKDVKKEGIFPGKGEILGGFLLYKEENAPNNAAGRKAIARFEAFQAAPKVKIEALQSSKKPLKNTVVVKKK